LNETIIKINLLIDSRSIKRSINLKIGNCDTIKDILKQSIDLFNDIFYREKVPLLLNKDYRIFYLKPSKKNGKPDMDLPSKLNNLDMNINTKVFETRILNFSLLYEDEKNIAVIKERRKCCRSCQIF
jgi:hypothetical protein